MARKNQIQAISFIALLALMILLMGRVFLPYSSVILWSAVSYILMSPLFQRIVRRMNPHKRLYELKRHALAGLFAILTVCILGGVLFFVGVQVIGQVGKVFKDAAAYVSENPLFFRNTPVGVQITDMVSKLSLGRVDLAAMDLKAETLRLLAAYSDSIQSMAGNLLRNAGNLVISLAFLCFTLYFCFIDGAYLAGVFINAIPIDQSRTRGLMHKFRDVTINLFKGFFLVAFYQALAAFVIFFAFRVEGAMLFAILVLFCSFIPMLGCALVWFPLGISIASSRGTMTGVAFMILCAVFISFLDNFLRPLFLKDRVKVHPLLIFFSILGGLKAFGANGILLGPLVVILFFTIVDMAVEGDKGVGPGEIVAEDDEEPPAPPPGA